MLAQTMAEYGALQSISNMFLHAYNRIESLVGQGNPKYILLVILIAIVLLFVRKRRSY
jgi:hypothetical protein